tara:strand:+ start:336 stop:641 length:306 start_codon:yes stop_codon:yes gene_type:complete
MSRDIALEALKLAKSLVSRKVFRRFKDIKKATTIRPGGPSGKRYKYLVYQAISEFQDEADKLYDKIAKVKKEVEKEGYFDVPEWEAAFETMLDALEEGFDL